MKIYMVRVEACKTCPAGRRRGTTWSKSEPVCELFMGETEPGRMGRVIPESVYPSGTPHWCPLDDLLEQKGEAGDARYQPVSPPAQEGPCVQRSRFFNALVFGKQMEATKMDESQKSPPIVTCEFCGGALRPCTGGPGYECETCGNFLPYDADGEPICLGCSKRGCDGHTCPDEVNHG